FEVQAVDIDVDEAGDVHAPAKGWISAECTPLGAEFTIHDWRFTIPVDLEHGRSTKIAAAEGANMSDVWVRVAFGFVAGDGAVRAVPGGGRPDWGAGLGARGAATAGNSRMTFGS